MGGCISSKVNLPVENTSLTSDLEFYLSLSDIKFSFNEQYIAHIITSFLKDPEVINGALTDKLYLLSSGVGDRDELENDVKRFICAGADPNICCPLMGRAALSVCSSSMVEFLIENDADVNLMQENMTPIANAIVNNNISKLAELIKRGADLEIHCHCDYTPLQFAVVCGNVNAIALLRKAGANKDVINNGKSLLELNDFFNGNNPSLIKKFIEEDITLFDACKFNNTPLVKLFLEEGIDVNVEDEIGGSKLPEEYYE
tara:strand:+ start:3532 stop:4305 length:774 start_codon:yes stop_codon:yes gene_type:complete